MKSSAYRASPRSGSSVRHRKIAVSRLDCRSQCIDSSSCGGTHHLTIRQPRLFVQRLEMDSLIGWVYLELIKKFDRRRCSCSPAWRCVAISTVSWYISRAVRWSADAVRYPDELQSLHRPVRACILVINMTSRRCPTPSH